MYMFNVTTSYYGRIASHNRFFSVCFSSVWGEILFFSGEKVLYFPNDCVYRCQCHYINLFELSVSRAKNSALIEKEEVI